MTREEAIKQIQGMVVGADWLNDHMIVALSVAIEALAQLSSESTTFGKWIPVSERLPETGQGVLVTNSRGKILCGQFQGVFDGNSQRWNWEGNTLIRVLAWMPMVEPYKES